MPLTSFLAKQFFKVLQKLPLVRIQIFFGSLSNPILNPIKNARDTAGNCRDRVAVASDTDRISNGVLERHRFKESFKSHGNGAGFSSSIIGMSFTSDHSEASAHPSPKNSLTRIFQARQRSCPEFSPLLGRQRRSPRNSRHRRTH